MAKAGNTQEAWNFDIHQLVMRSYTKFESIRADRSKILTAEKSKLSSQIANITHAIADRGALPPLLDKLTELTSRRAQLNIEQKLLSTPVQPLPDLIPEQVAAVSESMIKLLTESPPEQVKLILPGLIKEIHAERKAKEIIGTVTYWYPFPFDFASKDEMLSTGSSPVGALPYRQAFTIPLIPHDFRYNSISR